MPGPTRLSVLLAFGLRTVYRLYTDSLAMELSLVLILHSSDAWLSTKPFKQVPVTNADHKAHITKSYLQSAAAYQTQAFSQVPKPRGHYDCSEMSSIYYLTSLNDLRSTFARTVNHSYNLLCIPSTKLLLVLLIPVGTL